MDVVKDDVKVDGAREEDAEERVRWRHVIGCGDPRREQLRGKAPRKLGEVHNWDNENLLLVGDFLRNYKTQTKWAKPSPALM